MAAAGLPPGTLVAGRYRVEAALAAGGMGAIDRAVDVHTGRRVAIKSVLPELASEPQLERRLEREAQAASFVRHPNVVEVLALDCVASGGLALVMELAEGQTLRDALGGGALAPRRALVITREIRWGSSSRTRAASCTATSSPRTSCCARRRIGASSIRQAARLRPGQAARIAAEVRGADQLTTHRDGPRHARVHGAGAGARSRSSTVAPTSTRVGCMLYEMLVGRTPFDDADLVALMRKQVKEPAPSLPAAPWATPAVTAVVERALAKAPDARWRDATAMLAAVEAAFGSLDSLPSSVVALAGARAAANQLVEQRAGLDVVGIAAQDLGGLLGGLDEIAVLRLLERIAPLLLELGMAGVGLRGQRDRRERIGVAIIGGGRAGRQRQQAIRGLAVRTAALGDADDGGGPRARRRRSRSSGCGAAPTAPARVGSAHWRGRLRRRVGGEQCRQRRGAGRRDGLRSSARVMASAAPAMRREPAPQPAPAQRRRRQRAEVAAVRRLAGERGVQRRAEAVDVAGRREHTGAERLGRGVRRRAEELAGHRQLRARHVRDAEVGQLPAGRERPGCSRA